VERRYFAFLAESDQIMPHDLAKSEPTYYNAERILVDDAVHQDGSAGVNGHNKAGIA
jgi:hypothetical protein